MTNVLQTVHVGIATSAMGLSWHAVLHRLAQEERRQAGGPGREEPACVPFQVCLHRTRGAHGERGEYVSLWQAHACMYHFISCDY